MGQHHHSPFSTVVAPTMNSACTTTGLRSMQQNLQAHSYMFLFKASHIPGPDGLSNPSQDLCKIATHQLQRSPTEISLHQPSQALKSRPLLLSRSIQSNQLLFCPHHLQTVRQKTDPLFLFNANTQKMVSNWAPKSWQGELCALQSLSFSCYKVSDCITIFSVMFKLAQLIFNSFFMAHSTLS